MLHLHSADDAADNTQLLAHNSNNNNDEADNVYIFTRDGLPRRRRADLKMEIKSGFMRWHRRNWTSATLPSRPIMLRSRSSPSDLNFYTLRHTYHTYVTICNMHIHHQNVNSHEAEEEEELFLSSHSASSWDRVWILRADRLRLLSGFCNLFRHWLDWSSGKVGQSRQLLSELLSLTVDTLANLA